MASKALVEPITFEEAARLITKSEEEVAWLAAALRIWIWPQEQWPQKLRAPTDLGMFAATAALQLSRAKLLKDLRKTLPSAVDALDKLVRNIPLMRLLSHESLGANFGPLQLVHLGTLLFELRRRSVEASRRPEIVSADGKARGGRNRVVAPGLPHEKVACALTVMVAWLFVNGKPVGPYTKRALKAADLLFRLGMVPAGRFDQVKRPPNWGEIPHTPWARYFKAASDVKPSPVGLDAQFLRILEAARAGLLRAQQDHTLIGSTIETCHGDGAV